MVTARDTRRGWRRQERGGGRAPGSRRRRCVRRVAVSWPLSTAFFRRSHPRVHPVLHDVLVCVELGDVGTETAVSARAEGSGQGRTGEDGKGLPELGGGGGGRRAEVGPPGVCTAPRADEGALGLLEEMAAWGLSGLCRSQGIGPAGGGFPSLAQGKVRLSGHPTSYPQACQPPPAALVRLAGFRRTGRGAAPLPLRGCAPLLGPSLGSASPRSMDVRTEGQCPGWAWGGCPLGRGESSGGGSPPGAGVLRGQWARQASGPSWC